MPGTYTENHLAQLIYLINASLDGYIADDDDKFDWSEPSEDAFLFFNDYQSSVGTSLLGRRMYETMRVWDSFVLDDLPPVHRRFAEAWIDTDKVVYSTTLENVTEPRTRLEPRFDLEAVGVMKGSADRDMSIGGAVLAAEAIRAGLVDRYIVRVIPVIVGGGTRALPDAVRVDLVLDTTARFDDGSVVLDYRVRR